MASLVLGVVGGGLGFLAGGPAGFGMGFTIGSLIGGFFNNNQPTYGQLWDLHTTGSGYGLPIPWLYGGNRVGGTLVWSTPLVQHTSQVTPGKGTMPGSVKNYTYTCSFAIYIGRGPIAGIRRVWAQDLLVYDSTQDPPSPFNLTVYNGDEEQTPNTFIQSSTTLATYITPAYRGSAYMVFENFDLTNWSNMIPQFTIETLQDPYAPTTVYDVLTDVAEQCGMTEGVDFDFGAAYDDIVGFSASQRQPGYSIVQQLVQCFSTDIVETDGMLKAVRRGEPAVCTLAAGDLGCTEWTADANNPPPPVETTRTSDLSLPFRYDVGYSSYDQLYQAATQSAVRHSRQAVEDLKSLNTTIVLKDATAYQVASTLLDTEWLERSTNEISVSFKWLQLATASPFYLPVDGQNIRNRVTQMDVSNFGVIKIKCVVDGSANENGPTQGYMVEA